MRLALAMLVAACGGGASSADRGHCNLIYPPEATVVAHLPATDVPGATVTFCRDQDCASGAFASQLVAAHFTADMHDCSTGDGYGCIELTTYSTPFVDGEQFATTVTNAGGDVVFDVARPVRYDEVNDCNLGIYVQMATLNLYPTSQSGVECANNKCDAGVHVRGSFRSDDGTTPIVFNLCRQGLGCGQETLRIAKLSDGVEFQFTGEPVGVPIIDVEPFPDGDAIGYDIATREDSIVLADGDVYTLVIVQGDRVLAQAQKAVSYSADYPNGRTCDPVPCRRASVAIP